jgi:polysaccharide pyruvyl transferase WcaK-like protein
MSKILKPIFYYSATNNNIGDIVLRKMIIETIKESIDVPFALFNTRNSELTEDRIINQVNKEASVLMIAGGGLYCNIECSSGWYFPCPPELFEKIKVPIILYGIGYNNNLKGNRFKEGFDEKTKNSITLINKLSIYSTVRDQRTYNLLKDFGITNHELILDPACFIKYNEQPKIKRVAIQLAQHCPILGRFDGIQEYRDKNIKAYANICDYLKSKNYEVMFIAFDPLEQNIITELKQLFPNLLYMNTDNIDIILKEYSCSAFSIGCKMHSNILSFATHTPFISIYYDQKSPEFLKMIGWENFGISCFEPYVEQVKKMIDHLDINWDIYSEIFKDIQQEEKPKFITSIDKICEIIKNV